MAGRARIPAREPPWRAESGEASSAGELPVERRSRGRPVRRLGVRFGALDRVVDFTAMDRNLLRRFHAEADLISADLDDHDRDVVVDDDAFVLLPRQHQHVLVPFLVRRFHPIS